MRPLADFGLSWTWYAFVHIVIYIDFIDKCFMQKMIGRASKKDYKRYFKSKVRLLIGNTN